MNSKFSVIMPAYNAAKFIKESIESVLSQSYGNWELIVINDASTDNTKEIVNSYTLKDKRVKLINLERNKGIANARNIGIQHVTGRYVSFLDSDDLWKNEKLEKQKKFMEKNNVVFCYTEFELIDEVGKLLNQKRVVPESLEYKELLKVNHIGCLTVTIDLRTIKKVEMPYIKHEDYATWLRILKDYNIKAYGLKESLAYYRKTSTSTSANKLLTLKWTWDIYSNFLGYGKFKAIFLMCSFIINTIKKNFLL